MKTIEKRAKAFAQKEKYIDCIGCDSCSKRKEYNTYVDIATEQEKVDDAERKSLIEKVIWLIEKLIPRRICGGMTSLLRM